MKTVITFGTFDIIHVGHINILTRAFELGDRLVVGVSSDELNIDKKGYPPTITCNDRMRIISSLQMVSHVFKEESLDKKRDYVLEYNADFLVMGDDWEGKFDDLNDITKVVYLPRTPSISSTNIKNKIMVVP